ncbi:MAG TPA: hypothetical protein VGR56_05895 [Nitrososphaerales archaeon]|nr:hypothetical protein [Nitrososphaerales archaeon]
MSNLSILVWQNKEGSGEPEVEVKIPVSMVKWVPRLMKFVPKKTREENWGEDVDFEGMFADIDKMVKEASEKGEPELMTVRAKDAFVRIKVDK